MVKLLNVDPNELGGEAFGGGGGGGGGAPRQDSPAASLIASKFAEYARKSRLHKRLYLATRLGVAVSAGLLPFVVQSQPMVATALSVVTVLLVAVDVVLDPKTNWGTYSKATDLLAMAELKRSGDFDKYKEALDVFLATESARLEKLSDLDVIMKKMRDK